MKWVLLLPLTACLLAQHDDSARIRVISAGKRWSIDGRALMRGDFLDGASSVTGQPHADGLILGCGAKGWLAYACARTPCRIPPCAEKLDTPVRRVDEPPHSTERQDSLLRSLIKREPREVVTTGVRSVGVSDGIAVQGAQGTLWADVLGRVLDGAHCFHLRPLPKTPAGSTPVFIRNWQHSDRSSAIVRIDGLRPGLYNVTEGIVAGGACAEANDVDAAWVLIVSAKHFREIDSRWVTASSHLQRIARGVDPMVVATVRHALLAHLADTMRGQ